MFVTNYSEKQIMLTILVSWVILTIIFFSFGDFFLLLYNRICQQKDYYSFFERFLLGICFVSLILSVTSLWIPSNHYLMVVFLVLSGVYWVCRKTQLIEICRSLKTDFKAFRKVEWGVILFLVLLIASFPLWGVYNIDSRIYYLQVVAWNEFFPVVPGIANLEERLGFNSHFFLLSAPFTFRFVFDTPLFSIDVLLVVFILLWIVKEIFHSKYEKKRVFLFVIFIFYIVFFNSTLNSLTSDMAPNLIIFYLISKAFLYPGQQQNKSLLYITVLACLITFKLSTAVLGLVISLYLLYILLKNRDLKSITFIVGVAVLIVGTWCIRNIIFSGYLIYPFYELDLFSFDWKVPQSIAISERGYIEGAAYNSFNMMLEAVKNCVGQPPVYILLNNTYFIDFLLYVLALIANIIAVCTLFFKKKEPFVRLIILALIIGSVFWFKSAPYLRFASGIIFSLYFISGTIFIYQKKSIPYIKGLVMVLGVTFLFSCYIFRCMRHSYTLFTNSFPEKLIQPSTIDEKTGYDKYNTVYEKHYLNENVFINVSHSPVGYMYDNIPCSTLYYPQYSFRMFQDYLCIRARGNRIEDGFRYEEKNK